MRRYHPDSGVEKTNHFSEVVIILLVVVLVTCGIGAGIFVKSKKDERKREQWQSEQDAANSKAETMRLTIFPGMNMFKLKTYLEKNGFTDAEVDEAYASETEYFNNTSGMAKVPLIDGLLFPETFEFYKDDTASTVLRRFIDEQQKVIKDNDLVAKYKKQGLTFYQGLIIASIVQSEVSNHDDQKQVAQVFLKRYRDGIMLGSDVTAIYAADLKCFAETGAVCTERPMSILKIDSPYNTRKYKGLPPSPISNPGLPALLAVAEPAEGDYLYFLSGDDDVTYFARTEKEHEANKKNHCQIKCATL